MLVRVSDDDCLEGDFFFLFFPGVLSPFRGEFEIILVEWDVAMAYNNYE